VRLGKFETHYEELFAEAIEDGVITTEERARLDRAAETLGLDRDRIRKPSPSASATARSPRRTSGSAPSAPRVVARARAELRSAP
jgi:hypothetical protein